jgi:hypothetical protein
MKISTAVFVVIALPSRSYQNHALARFVRVTAVYAVLIYYRNYLVLISIVVVLEV